MFGETPNAAIGLKIFDQHGYGVYSSPTNGAVNSSLASAVITQPYQATSLTLQWNKVAHDGSRLAARSEVCGGLRHRR